MDRKEVDLNLNHFGEEIISQNIKTDTINLEDFVIQNQIGIGSFGKVYKLKNKKTGEIFAGKISLQKLDSNSETMKKDLLREVNIISKLNHPSILKFIGYSPFNFKNKPKPVIITEFAQNGSLRDLINSNFFDDTKKLNLLYGIASGMSYLHEYDIIHRDLKPENILIDLFLFPKIADFGLSKIIKQNDENILNKSISECKGTPIYMAPEIWEKYEYSNASDVYAFSIIAYEIITKNRPFKDLNVFTLPLKVKEGKRPDLNYSIPASYKNLIQQCWSQDPQNRPTFNEILFQLKNNDNFITENVNKDEYLNYIKYIDEQNITFDSFKKINIIAQSNILNISIFENIKMYPLRQFFKLIEECKIFVEEAESDIQKQFQLGQILVEGQGLFYQNAEIGMKYLEKSMNNGLTESAIYLCEMFTKGDIIPRNLKRARKILENHIKNDEPNYYLLLGKICKKEKKYREARINFFKSMNLGNSEFMYDFGRIIYKGKCDKANIELGITYFLDAIRNDCAQEMFKYGLILKNCEEYHDR